MLCAASKKAPEVGDERGAIVLACSLLLFSLTLLTFKTNAAVAVNQEEANLPFESEKLINEADKRLPNGIKQQV